MKKKLFFLIFIISFFIVLVIIFNYYENKKSKIIMELDKKELSDVDNLMVVAHPDDESLWGGIHLLNDDYLVICVTCVDKDRIEEFKNVLNITGDDYLILGYPDKDNNGEIDDWISSYDNIKLNLEEIVKYKKWDTIITHNPDGEYGHIHHKLLSKIISDISPKDKLYYFNNYYNFEEIENINISMISNDDLLKKERLLEVYTSQKEIIDNHRPNIKYEKFIPYKKWK